MTPQNASRQQIELYRQMTGEQRLLIGLRLHELACEMSRDAIRHQFPSANSDQVEEKLKQRLRLAYTAEQSKAITL